MRPFPRDLAPLNVGAAAGAAAHQADAKTSAGVRIRRCATEDDCVRADHPFRACPAGGRLRPALAARLEARWPSGDPGDDLVPAPTRADEPVAAFQGTAQHLRRRPLGRWLGADDARRGRSGALDGGGRCLSPRDRIS